MGGYNETYEVAVISNPVWRSFEHGGACSRKTLVKFSLSSANAPPDQDSRIDKTVEWASVGALRADLSPAHPGRSQSEKCLATRNGFYLISCPENPPTKGDLFFLPSNQFQASTSVSRGLFLTRCSAAVLLMLILRIRTRCPLSPFHRPGKVRERLKPRCD